MENIKILLDKLSSYNIFNHLFPGISFVFLTKEISGYNLIQDNYFVGGFLYYFIGMIVSRVGSIFIEPALKAIKFISFKDYKLFVQASKLDPKLELLSEVNNTYRTILSMLILLSCEYTYLEIKFRYNITHNTTVILATSFTTALFLFSYRKQTSFISRRIESNINK